MDKRPFYELHPEEGDVIEATVSGWPAGEAGVRMVVQVSFYGDSDPVVMPAEQRAREVTAASPVCAFRVPYSDRWMVTLRGEDKQGLDLSVRVLAAT